MIIFFSVKIDSFDNIICVGVTSSEGVGGDEALVVKLDTNLNILARKVYGGLLNDHFRDVKIDSFDNIICVGYTDSEGTNGSALVVKFDPNLNILARKVYGGVGTEHFYSITVDSSDNIICAGYTQSEGAGNNDTLVLKLPSDIPSGTFVGTILSGLTLQDSNLTLSDSNLTLADSILTLINSNLTLQNSNLILANSSLKLEVEVI